MAYEINYNKNEKMWELLEDGKLYYASSSRDEVLRVHYNCIMMEPQFEGEPEIDYDLDKGYEPFSEVDIEGGRNDKEDSDFHFIGQVLENDIWT